MEWKIAPKFEERMVAQKYYINGLGDLINNNGPRIYKGMGDAIQTAGEKTLELKEATVHIPEGIDVGTIKLYGKTLRETQFKLLKDNVQSGQAISLTPEIEYIKAEFSKPILARSDVYLTVKTKVIDEKWSKEIFASAESTSSTTLHNWGFVYYSDDKGKKIGEKYTEAVGSYNRTFLTLRVEYDNNWQTSIEAHNEDMTRLTYILTPNRVDENMPFTIVTLLPDSVDVINEYHRPLENMGYQVVHHYLGTDKTALIFTKTLKDIDIGENYPIQKYRYSFRKQIQFNKYLTKDVHQLDHYTYWYDPSVLKTTSGWADESTIARNNQLDLDGKGMFVGKSVLKAMTKVDFGPPEEVIIHEKIGHTPEDLSVHPLTGDGTWYGTLEDVFPEKDLNYVAHSTKVNTKAITDKLWETAEDLAVSDDKVWNDNSLRYLVTLKPGQELKLSFKTKIVKEEDGKIINRFYGINAENPDFNKDSNTVETQVHVRKLMVNKAVDKAEAKTGDTLTYKLTVENTGTAKWVGTLTDKLTDDLQALKTEVGSFYGNTLSVPIDLDQGQTQVITFTAKVLRKKAGKIFNRALVTHENVPELNVESNEVKTVVEEEPEPTPTEPGKESDNDKKLPNKENQGKPNKQTGSKVSKPKQIPAAKTKAKNDLPAAGTKQNGYLWLGVVSLGLACIMIYFDRKSRWHH